MFNNSLLSHQLWIIFKSSLLAVLLYEWCSKFRKYYISQQTVYEQIPGPCPYILTWQASPISLAFLEALQGILTSGIHEHLWRGSDPWCCTCLCCRSAQKTPRWRWDWAEHPGGDQGQACPGLATIRVYPLRFKWIKTPQTQEWGAGSPSMTVVSILETKLRIRLFCLPLQSV